MSGMPGVGKDHWIREHLPGWPMISLDKLREEMNIAPIDEQGAVLQAAKTRAKEYLRTGQDFVWNATISANKFVGNRFGCSKSMEQGSRLSTKK